jgi:hypothetical protein
MEVGSLRNFCCSVSESASLRRGETVVGSSSIGSSTINPSFLQGVCAAGSFASGIDGWIFD